MHIYAYKIHITRIFEHIICILFAYIMHMLTYLCIFMDMYAYFMHIPCILNTYFKFLHICAFFLHILCIFLHICAYFLHIYFILLHMFCIFVSYFMHMHAYLCICKHIKYILLAYESVPDSRRTALLPNMSSCLARASCSLWTIISGTFLSPA